MIVVVPSRGRAGRCRVLEKMPKSQRVVLVVPKDEVAAYRNSIESMSVGVVGVECAHIGEKRQKILDMFGDESIVMMDDDLRFRVREPGKNFRAAETEDVAAMLRDIRKLLAHHAHVGIADEFMCQHNPPGIKVGGRYNQVLAYDMTKIDKKLRPRFRLAINEEHDMHLQLLRMHFTPRILTDYTKGSKYNAVGGCSTWRTPEFELAQFEEFARLWPDVVRIQDGGNNLCGKSVRINWRRAAR